LGISGQLTKEGRSKGLGERRSSGGERDRQRGIAGERRTKELFGKLVQESPLPRVGGKERRNSGQKDSKRGKSKKINYTQGSKPRGEIW